MKEKSFISAVVYVKNAGNRIADFIKLLGGVLDNNFEHSEIICVNDASTDGTVDVIKGIADSISSTITVVNMSYHHGVELAMNAGMDIAIGDFIIEFDTTVIDYADDMIMSVYHKMLEGYDVVSAVPNKREKLTSKLFYSLTKKYSDLGLSLHTETFRIVSRRMLNRAKSTNATTPYRKIVYASSGLKMAELKYDCVRNRVANSREEASGEYRANLAIDSLLLFTHMGYRVSMLLTFVMMLMSLFMIVYSIVIYAMKIPVEGWTTTVLFLSFAFFGLFAILTIIIKYLQLLVSLVFRRKQYSFEGIEKLK